MFDKQAKPHAIIQFEAKLIQNNLIERYYDAPCYLVS